MNHIVAGQLAVTANDACPLCGYWTCRCKRVGAESLEFDSLAGQDALRDIVEVLEAEAANDVDTEDVAYLRSLLAAPIVRIARAAGPVGVAA